jgi:hypothetical protein
MEDKLQINGQAGNQESGSLEIVNPDLTAIQAQLEADSVKARETEAYREKVRCLPKLPGKEFL